MAPIVPLGEPETVRAGDTWQWRITDPDFPIAEGWTLSYAFRGASAPAWQAGWVDTSTGEYVVTVPISATTGIVAGNYQWSRMFTKAGQRFTSADGFFTVELDLAVAAAGAAQSHAERMVTILEQEIAARVAGTGTAHESYQIGPRALNKIPIGELRKMLGAYRARLERERNPNTLGRRIVARFTHPGAYPGLDVPGSIGVPLP